jgi:hypothetical protein
MQQHGDNWLDDARIAIGIVAIGLVLSGVPTMVIGAGPERVAAYMVLLFAFLQSLPLVWRTLISWL